jgi:hypothetical protein
MTNVTVRFLENISEFKTVIWLPAWALRLALQIQKKNRCFVIVFI